MFQEPPNDGDDGDVLAHLFGPWSKTADSSDDEIDLHSGLGSDVEFFDDFGVDE